MRAVWPAARAKYDSDTSGHSFWPLVSEQEDTRLMPRPISIFISASLIAIPALAWSQQLPAGVRSQLRFGGAATLMSKAKKQSVPVTDRTWTMAPGATIDDPLLGASGNLVVEVRSGLLTTSIDGQRQTRKFGDFFVIPAGRKVVFTTTGDHSAIFHTLLLPAM